MAAEWRIDELERRSNGHGRSLSSLSSRLAAVEQLANMLSAGMGGTFGGGGGAVRVGKASGAISASTATTPGSGSVQLLTLDGSGNYAAEATVSVFNAGSAISSGKRCFVLTDPSGRRWATPEECG